MPPRWDAPQLGAHALALSVRGPRGGTVAPSRPWRRLGMAGSTMHLAVGRLTGQEAADCGRGQGRDPNQ